MVVARISQCGQYIAQSKTKDSKIYVYNSSTKALLGIGNFHRSPINDIQFACGAYFATASEDSTIVMWKITLEPEFAVVPKKVFQGHVCAVTTLKFNYRSTLLVSGSVDEKIIIWDVCTNSIYKRLDAHSQPITAVDFNKDGELVISGCQDGFFRLWCTIDGVALRTLMVPRIRRPILCAKFTPSGEQLLTMDDRGFIRILSLHDGSIIKIYELPNSSANLREVMIIRDYVVAATDYGIYYFDLQSQQLISKLSDLVSLSLDYDYVHEELVLSVNDEIRTIKFPT